MSNCKNQQEATLPSVHVSSTEDTLFRDCEIVTSVPAIVVAEPKDEPDADDTSLVRPPVDAFQQAKQRILAACESGYRPEIDRAVDLLEDVGIDIVRPITQALRYGRTDIKAGDVRFNEKAFVNQFNEMMDLLMQADAGKVALRLAELGASVINQVYLPKLEAASRDRWSQVVDQLHQLCPQLSSALMMGALGSPISSYGLMNLAGAKLEAAGVVGMVCNSEKLSITRQNIYNFALEDASRNQQPHDPSGKRLLPRAAFTAENG